MIKHLVLFFFIWCLQFYASAKDHSIDNIQYSFSDNPIDVVIVCHDKDRNTLNDCIEGIRENCHRIRRVIVVSSKRLTEKAEWFNESKFPFSKNEIALEIARGDKDKAAKFCRNISRGPGWYFQQVLKCYASFIIPGISSNVLVIDADTIFLNPVDFLNEIHGGLFCVSYEEAKTRYLEHAARLVPGYKRVFPQYYSVSHHMLFQRPILKHLFWTVERKHKTSFWKAFCRCVDFEGEQGASEYEIYYNFALRHTDQVQIRELKWANSAHLDEKALFKQAGYHFVSFHTYMRGKWPKTFGEEDS